MKSSKSFPAVEGTSALKAQSSHPEHAAARIVPFPSNSHSSEGDTSDSRTQTAFGFSRLQVVVTTCIGAAIMFASALL